MMANDNDPILSGIKPSQEDIATRQRQLKSRRPTKQSAASSSANLDIDSKVTTKALNWPAIALAIVALAVAGFGVWKIQQLTQALTSAQNVIEAQQSNLQALNDKLSATDESANLSVDALKIILKEHDSEIRKLWDVSNKRNKANIKANTNSVTQLKKSLSGLESKQAEHQQTVSAEQAALSTVSKELSASIEQLEKQVAKAEAAALSLPAEADLRIAQNSEAIETLESKLPDSELLDLKLAVENLKLRLDQLQQKGNAQ